MRLDFHYTLSGFASKFVHSPQNGGWYGSIWYDWRIFSKFWWAKRRGGTVLGAQTDNSGATIVSMTKEQMKSVICKECLSVGMPIKVTAKNPELNNVARAAMYRYGFIGGFIHGFTSHRDQPIGCSACRSTNIIPVDTPMGQMLLSQTKKPGE